MATQYDTQIQQLYVAYFNRPADAGGIAHWANFMANGGTAAQVSAAFATTLEYQVEYSQSNFAGIVTQVYNNLFGHAPDSVGLAFWVKALTNKDMTVDNAVLLISQGAQGTDKDAFNAKVTVATAFTNALDTDAEKAGYTGKEVNDAAKAMLAKITTAAQATAAIEKTALDAQVAAVIKVGVPFTVESGLASLAAAQTARSEFLDDFAEANNLADDADVVAAVGAAVEAAKDDLVDLIEDDRFATASDGVKAALIADQEELNSDTLVAANAALKKATDAVTAKTGLGNAIAASTSAQAGMEVAEENYEAADAAYAGADAFFKKSNPTVVSSTTAGGVTTLKDGTKTIATQAADGTWKAASGVTDTNYAGLTALITAANNRVAAQAEVDATDEAATLAQLRVEMIDVEAGKLGATTFKFTITDPAAAIPTYNEVVNELSALTSASVTADAAVAAAPTKTGPAYETLQATANAARIALEAFEKNISDFIDSNDTVLANAVQAAEEGTMGPVAAEVAEIAGLAAAIAADSPTPAQTTLLTTNATLVAEFRAEKAKAMSDDMDVRVATLGKEGAQAAIDALAEAREGLEDAQATAAELKSLQDAVTAVEKEFVAAEYLAPITLGASGFGTTDSDIFVAGTVNSTVTNFGRSGDDVLFVGSGFTLNKGALSTGDDSSLEVFFTQRGNNAVITIESKAYGSDSGDVHTVTLTGVNVADLTFEDGIITL